MYDTPPVPPAAQAVLDWALFYSQRGFVPIPQYVPIGYLPKDASGRRKTICSCPKSTDCGDAGRHPIFRWKDSINTPEQGYADVVRAVQQEYGRGAAVNLAIATGPRSGNLFVLDLDIKEGKDGVANFRRWCEANGISTDILKTTAVQISGGGGRHVFFKAPEGVTITNANTGEEFGPGIDIKGTTLITVVPSVHQSGNYYRWENPEALPIVAPDKIWQTAQKKSGTRVGTAEVDTAYTPTLTEVKQFADKLARSKGETNKQIGKDLQAALRGDVVADDGRGGHDVFRDMAFALVKQYPTADVGDLCEYLEDAIETRLREVPGSNTDHGSVLHAFTSAQEKVQERKTSWVGKLSVNDAGHPLSTQGNAYLFLTNHGAWKDTLALNSRLNKPVFVQPPPFERPVDPGVVNLDYHTSDILVWFQSKANMSTLTPQAVSNAIISAAQTNRSYDPLVDYLDGLRGTWDGQPRLINALQRILGAPETRWTRLVFPLWMTGLVARIMKPGCKNDTMLILESPQGYMKSTFFKHLLPSTDYFSESLPHQDLEVLRAIHSGPAVFELGELKHLRKKEVEEIKHFLSTTEDHFRQPYGRDVGSYKRKCVFVGTTNDEQYLTDATGARRFWPIRAKHKAKLEILDAERDQWFAEALFYFEGGYRWWLEGDEEHLAEAEQDDRYEEDIWHQPVAEWLANRRVPQNEPNTASAQMEAELDKKLAGDFVTLAQVAEAALHIELKHARSTEGMRLAKILRKEGWVSGRLPKPKQTRGFFRPTT